MSAFHHPPRVSVIVCTHNPRPDYLARVLDALQRQTLDPHAWELLIVDNQSREPVAQSCDVSWHPNGRLVREDTLGLTPARLRGLGEASGDWLVFVDDDNVLACDYLERAVAIGVRFPFVGVIGAGALVPEFEREPDPEIRRHAGLLAVRSVPRPQWSDNPGDQGAIPWGAGLCVNRAIVPAYRALIDRLAVTGIVDRRGDALFAGGDDLFSWAAASVGSSFGIFPELTVTHLIAATRLSRAYLLRLMHDHAYSHGILHYLLESEPPPRRQGITYVRLVLHGLRRGPFSMRCRWAQSSGYERAARLIEHRRLTPLPAGAAS